MYLLCNKCVVLYFISLFSILIFFKNVFKNRHFNNAIQTLNIKYNYYKKCFRIKIKNFFHKLKFMVLLQKTILIDNTFTENSFNS